MITIIRFLTLLLFSFNAFSFHEVTEILPSGKILVCKDYGQIRRGNIVEEFSKKSPSSKMDKSLIKTGEMMLPEIGQKIILTHGDFHVKGKMLKFTHSEELGTAIVSSESLEGEDRIIHLRHNSRFERQTEKVIKISKEEAIKIQADCFVAIPENGLKLNERASVSWE